MQNLMPRRVVFQLIMITLARRYDNAGVNAGRTKRGRLVSAILDLLSPLPPEIIDAYDLETENEPSLRISDMLCQTARWSRKISAKLPKRGLPPIEQIGNDWLISELFWFLMDWYESDSELRPPYERLLIDIELVEAAAQVAPINLDVPRFEMRDLLLEANDRWSYAADLRDRDQSRAP